MKSKARRKDVAGGGIVIEASNRKARRKEQRQAKKKQHQISKTRSQVTSATTSSISYEDYDDDHHASKKNKSNAKKSRKKVDAKDGTTTGRDETTNPNKRIKFSNTVEVTTIPSVKNPIPTGLKKKSRKSSSSNLLADDDDDVHATHRSNNNNNNTDYYKNLDDETAAALLKDDMEISYLESTLGIKKSKSGKGNNRELNREYSKNEGFGDDFGDFLMGLDDLVERCVGEDGGGGGDDDDDDDISANENGGSTDGDSSDDEIIDNVDNDNGYNLERGNNTRRRVNSDDEEEEEEEEEGMSMDGEGDDPYAHLDEDTAFALRNDDAEIAQLEEKLGLATSSKAKKKLNKEFSTTFQGYGEDFGDFLDGLDRLGERIGKAADDDDDDGSRDDYGSSGDERSMDGDDGDGDGREGEYGSGDESSDDGSGSEEEDVSKIADHDAALTYRPTAGEDIYGNKIDASGEGAAKPSKYVPPHLRKKVDQEVTFAAAAEDADIRANDGTLTSSAMAADPETIKLIQRSLNNSLNRLSEQTLESVSKSIASFYSQFPFHDMNDCLWKNIQMACIPPHMVMSGLIPLYVGAMSGVHWLGGDGIQLGGCLVEWSVKKLFDSLGEARKVGALKEDKHEMINKKAANLLLIVCYLYNYGVIHCTLIYDLVRDFIRNFTEIDVESLLIVLSHCGQQLRADDPSALKDIVLLVKDRAQNADDSIDGNDQGAADSSRIEYIVDTIIELKNNKPRKQDLVVREKTNALKKSIGRIKSSASQSLAGKKSGSCLRVTLRDVLDAETKGRWWMVGASWAGNQHHGKLWGENEADEPLDQESSQLESSSSSKKASDEEDGLLSLASSQRMNTDARRSIFCIVMGSSDCNDAFEKLVRQGMLKPKAERDVIRVIIHCCGEEKAFNPFYAYLAMRVCEFQQKSKFTLMLTFWDAFKQLESFSVRKIANLAKLLAHLIGSANKCLTIGVLKRVEFSPSDMPESVVVFLSIFMSVLFESSEVEHIRKIFAHGTSNSSIPVKHHVDSDEDDGNDKVQTTKKEDLSDLRESLSVFLLQYLKSSPKNVEGSAFRSNLLAAIETCDEANTDS